MTSHIYFQVVFAGIILIIVTKPNSKDDEEGPDVSLAIGAPKNGQNEVPLIFTGPAIVSRSGERTFNDATYRMGG